MGNVLLYGAPPVEDSLDAELERAATQAAKRRAKKYPQDTGGDRELLLWGEVTDSNGHSLRVQDSSGVEPHIWIFCKNGDGEESAPLLSEQGARELRAALTRWLKSLNGKR